MHNGHSQRRGKFLPLISVAFVDSENSGGLRVPKAPVWGLGLLRFGSKGQVVVKHRWLLDVRLD